MAAGTPDDMPNEMDEWDALEAEIAREAQGQADRTGKRKPADLKAAADAFLKKHKDVPTGDGGEDDATEAEPDSGSAERIAELEMQVATMKDQALRTLAEADNIRKRSEREVQNAKA